MTSDQRPEAPNDLPAYAVTALRNRAPLGIRRPAIIERGYSTIELAVTLAVVGILLTMSVFSIRPAQTREQIDGWARSMTYDIASAQQAAITKRTTITVTLSSSSYLVATSGGTTLRYAALPSDVSITSTCPANICSFDRRGTPISLGTITLTSAFTGRSFVITIQPQTGSPSYQ